MACEFMAPDRRTGRETGASFLQRPMRSSAVVIGRMVFQNPAQMFLAQDFLAQDNDVVQTLAPERSDQPFGKAILPRRSEAGAIGLSRMPMARSRRVTTVSWLRRSRSRIV
jgi:hypothetical protein